MLTLPSPPAFSLIKRFSSLFFYTLTDIFLKKFFCRIWFCLILIKRISIWFFYTSSEVFSKRFFCFDFPFCLTLIKRICICFFYSSADIFFKFRISRKSAIAIELNFCCIFTSVWLSYTNNTEGKTLFLQFVKEFFCKKK